MASSVRTTTVLALELGGQPAGSLHSAQPAPVRVERAVVTKGSTMPVRDGGTVSLGEMGVEAVLGAPGPLMDWLVQVIAGGQTLMSGAVLVLDANHNIHRRIDFSDATLTELQLPVLDAADGKRGFIAGLKWQPGRLEEAKASGKYSMPLASKRKPMQCGNFRLLGLPFDAGFVLRVGLPTVTVRRAADDGRLRKRGLWSVDAGELRLVMLGGTADAARAWVHQASADGRIDAPDLLSLTIEMLDASLKKVLATIKLDRCSLLAFEEDRIDASAEAAAGVTMRLAVGQLGLALTA